MSDGGEPGPPRAGSGPDAAGTPAGPPIERRSLLGSLDRAMAQADPARERRSPASLSSSRFLLASLVAFLALVAWLAYLVFAPFLLDLAVAGAVALLLGRLNARVIALLRGRRSLAAFAIVALVSLLILLPLVSYGALVMSQAASLLTWVRPHLEPQEMRELLEGSLDRWPRLRDLATSMGIDRERITSYVSPALSQVAGAVSRIVQSTVARLGAALFDLLVFLAILFFLLRDGHRLGDQLRRISPLSDAQETAIGTHLARTVKGVLQAMVVVPLAQGLLAMIGFTLCGVPSPLFWGAVLILAALVPGLGSPLVWVPASVFVFLDGSPGRALLLALYGLLVISTIDNVLKSILLGGAAGIHPMLAFLSTFGGLLAFGLHGFIVGPLVLSLLLSAVRIYEADVIGARGLAARAGPPPAPE